MLLDSAANLRRLHSSLLAFLSSASVELPLPSEQSGSPAPYATLLSGLHVSKGAGPVILSLLPNGWLHLEGSVENLRRYASYFHFPPEQEPGHHHPEHCSTPGYLSSASLNLIIEADSTWGEERAA